LLKEPTDRTSVPTLNPNYFIMQRSTIYLTRRAQALLPCDDADDGAKNKPSLAFYFKHAKNVRKTNLGALLFGVTFVMLYVGGFMSASHPLRRSKVVVATAPTMIQPLACHDFIRQVRGGSYRVPVNVHDPNHKNEGYRVTVKDPNLKSGPLSRLTTTEFPFHISLHHEEYDRRRWNIYKHGSYYQHAREQIWTDILRDASPGAHVIDIGYVIYVMLCYTPTVLCSMLRCFVSCQLLYRWPWQPTASRPCLSAIQLTTTPLFFNITVASLATTHCCQLPWANSTLTHLNPT
jgi:hypothetical protein